MQTDRTLDVLVVDDEFLIRWAIARTLSRAGHRVREAFDAAGALEALMTDVPPDVVLLDYRLPGAHGLDLLSTVHAKFPASAIVMMTADQTADAMAMAVELGAYKVMQKPFDMADIEPTLFSAQSAQHASASLALRPQ